MHAASWSPLPAMRRGCWVAVQVAAGRGLPGCAAAAYDFLGESDGARTPTGLGEIFCFQSLAAIAG